MLAVLCFLKEKQHVQYSVFLLLKVYICVGRTGKYLLLLSTSAGGQKSKEFNHNWHHSFWHQKEQSLTTSMVVPVIQPSFRSGKKEPNASQHSNRAVCCSQRTKHKTQADRKNILSSLQASLHFLRGKLMLVFVRRMYFTGDLLKGNCSQRWRGWTGIKRLAFILLYEKETHCPLWLATV